jgi:hypothetical protein
MAARLPRRLPGVHVESPGSRLARRGRVSLEARSLERRIEALVADHPLRTLPGAGHPIEVARPAGYLEGGLAELGLRTGISHEAYLTRR